MSNVFGWDELNILKEDASRFLRDAKSRKPSAKAVDGFCDYMEFVLCLVYAYGWHDAEEIVGIVPFTDGLDDKAVNLEIKGETFRDRIREQMEAESEEGIMRIIDTEAHRDYNTGVYDAAVESGYKVMKRWNTMEDERVRDTHDYLAGATVGLEDRFYTYTGESALFPGGFGTPEEDCNCRCFLSLVAG